MQPESAVAVLRGDGKCPWMPTPIPAPTTPVAARSPRPRRVSFDLKYSAGTLAHERLLRSIELYGPEVIPRVRQLLAEASPVPAERGVAATNR